MMTYVERSFTNIPAIQKEGNLHEYTKM